MITLQDIERAAATLAGQVANTPCLHSRTLSELTGAEIHLKFENHQFTASFKERGALNRLTALTADERRRGVIAASAGNHAQGVAHHAQRLGVPATIVMPQFTPQVKVERTRAFGAEIVLTGENFDAAYAHAQTLAQQRNLVFIHPYDDPLVMAGQGTVALEMLAAVPSLDTLVVPIGGGGLIAGMATAGKALRPGLQVIGVESRRFPSMACALRGEAPAFGRSTIAEGIAVRTPGTLTLPLVRERVDDIVLVDEGDFERAILLLLEIEKTVVEGAGAAGLAAVLANPARFRGRRVGLVLCGGNIDPLTLAFIIARGLVRTGRLARIAVELDDRPGALARATATIAAAGANIEEVHHQRAFTQVAVQSAEVLFVIQTRDHAHAVEVVEQLCTAGFRAHAEMLAD
ncbi:MAG: threonine ammonia-lyase [Burkholderiales bacterium]